ncbi:MAG TPA: DUF6807 family protein [Prosthecobacter sp.]|nr:DUF6807 family protein [Prosthecobacter sp.]
MKLTSIFCIFAISGAVAQEGLKVEESDAAVQIRLGQVVLGSYQIKSEIIKRPGFINVRSTNGTVITRPFPVQESAKSGGDHPDMHPGIWLGFGDINGVDFWRNKGRVEHVKFTRKPSSEDGIVRFAVLNRYLAPDGKEVCQQTMEAVIRNHPQGWRMTLETELWSNQGQLSLGAQEEMGLGVRMAGALNEKSGGMVRNSLGDRGAKAAWGKVADWWDYSGPRGETGVLVAPSPANTPKSWGHTRDYGVMVINPTPREPPGNQTVIPQGQHLKLSYEILIHDETGFSAASAAAALGR